MAKTNNSLSARRTQLEVTVSAALVAALASLTTAEDIDMGSITMEVAQAQVSEREITEDNVFGDIAPIITPDGVVSGERYDVTILYTQGKDQLGTDLIDIYSDLLLPLHLLQDAISIPHSWSPAGGNVGDERYVTDPNQTFLASLPKPVGGSSSDKIKITYQIACPVVGVPVIVA